MLTEVIPKPDGVELSGPQICANGQMYLFVDVNDPLLVVVKVPVIVARLLLTAK